MTSSGNPKDIPNSNDYFKSLKELRDQNNLIIKKLNQQERILKYLYNNSKDISNNKPCKECEKRAKYDDELLQKLRNEFKDICEYKPGPETEQEIKKKVRKNIEPICKELGINYTEDGISDFTSTCRFRTR